ncbi:hypothetical protein BB561_001946 [Smittium simulii]|uniref:Pacifastin domain-containing protein n=1 Tax=Smittium simulii TaxID=133385 RepID=A0A2T9YS92_9FUNG|nr:hypothetical protein BB561_001946 [Smittium simulii]
MFKLFILLSVALVCVFSQTSSNSECIKRYGSESFKSPNDSCNTCRCGTIDELICTKDDCLSIEAAGNISRKECIEKYGRALFRSPKDNCNFCVCLPKEGMKCTTFDCANFEI